jgi:chromosome segregation ATPase
VAILVKSVGRAGSVKHILVALLTSQLLGGCVATNNELRALRSDISYQQQDVRGQQQHLEKRITAIEANLRQVEKNRSTLARHDEIAKRMAAIEAQLQKLEKSSALAVQMGLISSVHADRNDEGIVGVRQQLVRLTAEIQALEARLLESDKQLETGLIQLKDLSGKLK